jgi:GNAT superfamily N-acetyltransferase
MADSARMLKLEAMKAQRGHMLRFAWNKSSASHGHPFMIKTTTFTANTSQVFKVRWVFGDITEALRRQIVAFWLQEGALPNADEAWRRSFEVVCVLQDETGSIAGICTVAIHMDDNARSYGFVRIFIRPDNRRVGLNVRLMERMIEGFVLLAGEPGAPQRLIATIENRKLERRGAQRMLARLGFVHIGTAPNGELVMQRGLAA